MCSQRLARLDRFLAERYVTPGRLPCALLQVAREGQLVHQTVLGKASLETGAPLAEDSIVRIYSMTKPVVSVAAMQLVEEGRIGLDEPVSKYLPEMRNLTIGMERDGKLDIAPAKREMTVRDLMRHTSGITYGVFGKGRIKDLYNKSRIGDPGLPNAELVRRLRGRLEMWINVRMGPLLDAELRVSTSGLHP